MACDQLVMEGDGTELKEVTPISCSNLWQRHGMGCLPGIVWRVPGLQDRMTSWTGRLTLTMKVQSTLYFLSRLASFSVWKKQKMPEMFHGSVISNTFFFFFFRVMCWAIPWKQRIHKGQTHWLNSPPLLMGQCRTLEASQLLPTAQTSVAPPLDHRRITWEIPMIWQMDEFERLLRVRKRWTWGALLWDDNNYEVRGPCYSHWRDLNGLLSMLERNRFWSTHWEELGQNLYFLERLW